MSSRHQLDQLTRYLRSPVIRILAGADKESLNVHVEALLSCGSLSLQKLLSGDWKESHERVVDWSYVEVQTIERFLTFCYARDYLAPDPTTVPSDGSDQNEHSNKESKKPKDQTTQIDWLEEHPLPAQDEVVDACGLRPLTPMRECYEEPPKRITTGAGRFEEVSLPSGKHSYQETLLAHAQVYVFAEYHLVEKLQRLALQRLNQVLLHQDCTQAHAVTETVSTIRYIYNNTTKQESHEPIRKLVSQFAAFHYVDLMKDEFEDLLTEGGDFALDVARKLRRRLAVSEKCPEEQNQLLRRRLIRSIS